MWTYVLRKLDGTAIGEVRNASERSLTLALNAPSTASFTIPANNALVPKLFGEDTLLQVWEGATLRFYGFVLSVELAGDSTQDLSVSVNAVDPAWRLSRRLLGTLTTLTFQGDYAKSAARMIDKWLNRDSPGEIESEYPTNRDTRIRVLAQSEYSCEGEGTFVVERMSNALKSINDIARHLKGFDWRISPLDNFKLPLPLEPGEEGVLPKIGLFEAKPNYGAVRTTFFEFGFGKNNIANLTYKRDLADTTNKAFHVPDEGLSAATSSGLLSEQDLTSIESRGRWEEEAVASGLNDKILRETWLDEVIRVKKNANHVITADLRFDGPQLGVDFFLGDTVTIRGKVGGRALFEGKVRVYRIDVSIDENGTALLSPTFLDEGGEAL